TLRIGFVSAVLATALGTLAAVALTRSGRFAGRRLFTGIIYAPLVMPEVITGLSLLLLFVATNAERGFWTVTIAHTTVTMSFVTVVVQSRLLSFDRSLEEAAMDLGANELTTFRKVTLPLIAPAILAGGLLSFALSIDDFVITYFNAGSNVTFPIFVWGSAQRGVPPQVNVFGTVIFVVALTLMVVNVLYQRRREGQAA
ncbi:MAG TPA: ABC transporter permease, partial [Gaiellaceae bacterium]